MTPLAEELTKAGVDWRMISDGGTVHSFANPDAGKVEMEEIAYKKSADEQSWKAITAFFEESFV